MDKNGGLLAFSLLLKVLKMASMAINIIYLSFLNFNTHYLSLTDNFEHDIDLKFIQMYF